DLDLLRFGHDRHGCGRRVDATLRLRLRYALHAMRAALPLEDGVRTLAADREGDLLEAAGVVRACAELLDLEAAPLCVARQRTKQIARPDRGLVAADALTDLDDHVLAVGGIGRRERNAQLLLELAAPLLQLGHELTEDTVSSRLV